MGGGSLSLSSKGTGDDILSLNPQITFFKKVYKRHTNFGLESKKIEASSVTNGSEASLQFGSNLDHLRYYDPCPFRHINADNAFWNRIY